MTRAQMNMLLDELHEGTLRELTEFPKEGYAKVWFNKPVLRCKQEVLQVCVVTGSLTGAQVCKANAVAERLGIRCWHDGELRFA